MLVLSRKSETVFLLGRKIHPHPGLLIPLTKHFLCFFGLKSGIKKFLKILFFLA